MDPNQKRGSRFSFKRGSDSKNQSGQENLQKYKDRFKLQMHNIIQPQKQVEIIDPKQRALKMAEKLGVTLTEEDLICIKFSLEDYQKNYVEEEVLGEGCIGLVKSIRRRSDQKAFAVKIVKTTDEEIVKNMILEFQNLQLLNHPNIVQMYEIYIAWKEGFQATGTVCIVMEKIEGKEMFEVIQSCGHYDETNARTLFRQILSAIHYMHDHFVCHRDLKPNNILCSNDFSLVKITDFNVSKFSDQYKEFGNLENAGKIEMWTYTGTVGFSAPEIFSGGIYNESVDMWSAGCILYTMLSGQLPFNSEWLNDLIIKIQKGEYEMTGDIWQTISDEAKDLISQMLKVDSNNRITPQKALDHEWITQFQDRKVTLKRDNLRKNIVRLTVKHDTINQQKKMRQLCYLFGAGEVWKRHSIGGLGNSNSLIEDFKRVKSFDMSSSSNQEAVKITKEEGKNVYKIEMPFEDSDEEEEKK